MCTDIFEATSGCETVTAKKTIYFDSGRSIDVYAVSEVTYAYEEGVSGWIEDCDTVIHIGSNYMHPDKCQLVYVSDLEKPKYEQRYYIYCYKYWSDFDCYINVYVYCDEWGDLSTWITYDNVNVYE